MQIQRWLNSQPLCCHLWKGCPKDREEMILHHNCYPKVQHQKQYQLGNQGSKMCLE